LLFLERVSAILGLLSAFFTILGVLLTLDTFSLHRI
jgi:hypothetical protein